MLTPLHQLPGPERWKDMFRRGQKKKKASTTSPFRTDRMKKNDGDNARGKAQGRGVGGYGKRGPF